MPSPGGPGRSLAEYASQAAPEEVIRFYRAEMPRLGWAERKLQRGTYAQDGLTVLWYSNAAGDSCIIAVSTRPAAETAVTISPHAAERRKMKNEIGTADERRWTPIRITPVFLLSASICVSSAVPSRCCPWRLCGFA